MAFIKQFLTKTRPSDNTSIFRYSPSIDSANLEIYSLISIVNDVDAESSRFNKFVWDGFIDGFLQQEGDVITRLKNALIGAEFKLRELIRHDDLLEEKGVNLDLSAVVFKGPKAYVAVLGDHKVLVYKTKVIEISEILAQNKSNVGTMLLSPGDSLLFYHSSEKLDTSLKDSAEMEEYLTKVFDNEDAKGGAFVTGLEPEEDVVETLEPETKEAEGDEQEVEDVEKEVEVERSSRSESERDVPKFDIVKEKLGVGLTKGKVFLGKVFSKSKEKATQVREKRGNVNLRSLKIGGYKDKDMKIRRFVTLAIFLVVLLTLFFGIKSAFDARESRVIGAELQEFLVELDERSERAEGAEVEEGYRIINTVHDDFDTFMLELEEEGKQDKLFDEDAQRVAEFREKIVEIRDGILKIVTVSEEEGNISLFLNTKLDLGEKSNPVDMVITKPSQIAGGEFIYIADRGEKAVYEISLATGEPPRKIGDPQNLISKPAYIDVGNDPDNPGVYVYDLDEGVLVARQDSDGKFNGFKTLSGVSARGLGGEKIKAFAVFGMTDSLNFLVPEEKRIVRALSAVVDSYSPASEFISYPAFEDGFDLFGDQYIYVLARIPNGIKRFVPATALSSPVSITGLPYDLSISSGYTGNTMDRVFVVFDDEYGRFVTLEKPIDTGVELLHPGELLVLNQFEYRGNRDDVLTDVRDIVVEYTDRSMFVLDGVKIWKINIVAN